MMPRIVPDYYDLIQLYKIAPQFQHIMNKKKAEEKIKRNNSKKTSKTNQTQQKTSIQNKPPQIKQDVIIPIEAMQIQSTITQQTQTRHIVKYLEEMLQNRRNHPSQIFKQMLTTYEKEPEIFKWRIHPQKRVQNAKSPILFYFVDLIVMEFQEFPFDKSEKTINIFDDLVRFVNQETHLSQDDILFLSKINENIWHGQKNKPLERIIENAMNCLMQVQMVLLRGLKQVDTDTSTILSEMMNTSFKGLIISLQKNKDSKIFTEMIRVHIKDILSFLSEAKTGILCDIPLFDFTALSLASQHYQFYQQIIRFIFCMLDKHLDDRKFEKYEGQEIFQQQCRQTSNVVFTVSKIFHYSSVFSQPRDQPGQNMIKYPEEIMILMIFNFKKQYIKVLEELSLLSKNHIPETIIRNIFKMASYCYKLAMKFPQYFNTIQRNPKLSKHMKLDKNYEEMNKQEINTLEVNIFHKLLYTIQKLLQSCDFELFLDLYIDHPIFVRDFFIQNIFYHNNNSVLLKFMVLFTKKWLLVQLENRFNFNYYLMTFLDKCINNDRCQLIGSFLKQLEVPHLLKINQIIFELSFEEEKKSGKPESSQNQYQLAYITSAGFADKYSLVNKIFPDFSEQLVWKQIIKSFFSTQSFYFIYVKIFYNVVHHQFDFSQESAFVINKILTALEASIHGQGIEKISSIFHFINCVCFKNVSDDSQQTKRKNDFQGRLLEFLIQKSEIIMGIYRRILTNRQSAMMSLTSLNASLQKQISNVEFDKKLKRLNIFFMESIVRWMQRLQNVSQIINHRRRYEDILETYKRLGKGMEFSKLHLQRVLSYFCSSNVFENTIETKITEKVINKKYIQTSQLMYLIEIMSTLINKYGEQTENKSFSLSANNILDFYGFVLKEKLEVTREREQLKQKLLILDNLRQIISFFSQNQGHEEAQCFDTKFHESFKQIILEIALHNPDIIGKYERQLIIHLRITATKLIVLFYGTFYEILAQEDFYGFVFELCVDKAVEIRMMILNIMTSRFKSEYKHFLVDKHRITSFLTIFCIFQPSNLLKSISKKVIQSIKKGCQQNVFFGFEVLIFSMKMILNDILKSLQTSQDQFVYIDKFCKGFDEIWLSKKQVEYLTFLFIDFFIEEKRIVFGLNQLAYNRYGVTRQAISRQKQDILLEQEIKEDLKYLDFEFPPEQSPDVTNIIKNTIEALPYKFFEKLKQLIIEKGRPSRYLKGKRDIQMHWKVFQEKGLILLKAPRKEEERF